MKKRISAFWRRYDSSFWFVAVFLALGACASQFPQLTPSQFEWAARRWPETTPAQLEAWRSLYVLKCSGCHLVKDPGAYTAEQWPKIMEKMSVKAKLSQDQEDVLMRYILTVVENPPTPPEPSSMKR